MRGTLLVVPIISLIVLGGLLLGSPEVAQFARRVQVLRVTSDLGFRVWGLGFWVWGFTV